ncbi:MAG: hypothetical protein WCJ30_03590 [Deltaproteobacteria bacterium]
MRTPWSISSAVFAAMCGLTTPSHAQSIATSPAAVVVPAAVVRPPVAPAAPPTSDATAPEAPPASGTRPAEAPTAGATTPARIRSEQVAVSGSSVPAGRVSMEVHAPYAAVCAVVTDFASFREIFPMRESRVIHRRRGQADVYFRVDLVSGAGSLWALSRFNVQRGPDVTRVDSALVEGNLRRLDVSFEVRAVPGDASRSTLSMQLLGLPAFYFPEGLLGTQQMRWAERGIEMLRNRAESLATPTAASR